MKTKAETVNSISEFLGMRAVPGKGYWIALCVAEFLLLWVGLAFLSHSLNFKFRERKKYLPCKTSGYTNSETGVRTKSGARISAPLIPPSVTRSREKTKTPENIPEEAEDDLNSAERRTSILKQDAEQPHKEDFTVLVEEVEENDGHDDKRLSAGTLRPSKDKARAVLDALAEKEQSEHESGVALSSIHRSPVSRAVHEESRYEEERDDKQQHADQKTIDDRREEVVGETDELRDKHQVDEQQHADKETIDDGREQAAKKIDELRDEPGPVQDRPRADTNDRWSCQGETSESDTTTRASCYQLRTSSVSDYCQQSERYDAADESSRSGTPMSRLNIQRDGVSGRLRHLTEGGHVFNMVERLSRHEE